jgi:hypothetical protein
LPIHPEGSEEDSLKYSKESSNECIERLVPPIDTVRRSLCEASLTLPFGLIFLLLHSIPKILKSGIMLGLWLWHVQVASMELWKCKKKTIGLGKTPSITLLGDASYSTFQFLCLSSSDRSNGSD